MSTTLTIDEMATRTGLTAHTLRYYERIGLIGPVSRTPAGHRCYSAADLRWLHFLLRLRATQMPISQMQAFARLRAAGDHTARHRRQMLEQHLAQVNAQIATLQQAAAVLGDKIIYYRELEQAQPAGLPGPGHSGEQDEQHTLSTGNGKTTGNRRRSR
ncbi:MerR family transcriptional regulator [Shimwellia pseudoproteus]|uniref:MerR family transcriptional regulator n=1 Tax=Shimwellia pseudoproteus TaxID=570012 RepID=UPI0018EE16DC|nr:MerR family transcriptional regulator [Shimwellia pseudoproteus]MBJ3815837.1 MerR family transcriptional regulator [Shimwellia pseudoproteus]